MSSDWDGLFSLLTVSLIIAAVVIAAMVGFMLVPVVIVAGAIGYYVHNHYLPAKKEEQAQARTLAMYKKASKIAPTTEDFYQQLAIAGVESDLAIEVAGELYKMEGLAPPTEPPPFSDTVEGARYRDTLLKYIETANADHFEKFSREVKRILGSIDVPIGAGIFHSRMPRTPQEIEDLILPFYKEGDCFRDLKIILDRNYDEQDGTYPTAYKGDNCAWDYLKDTPLLQLEYIERNIGLENRTSHTHILGGSGSGKTNLMEFMISRDLEEDCCVVVIDSQVQMIPQLAQLNIPTDEVTYIHPKWNLGLNLFDVGYQDMKESEDAETIINKSVGLIRFVLEGMLESKMTDRQKTVFDYAIQLVISIPGGNIFTFMEILQEGRHLEYKNKIDAFDENTRAFFYNDFGSDKYRQTREAVRSRLQILLKNPTFRRLFAAPENKMRMYDELQNRKLILIDTNKPLLDKEGSAFLGRLFVAMILQSAHRRFDNQGQYKPVYVYVDEAHEYFDESIEEMLEQARKSNIGLILAHQTIAQAKEKKIRAHLHANTATKIVSTEYRADAAEMAESMHVKPEKILELPQYSFGLYSRSTGFTSIRAPAHALSRMEKRLDNSEIKTVTETRYGVQKMKGGEPSKTVSKVGESVGTKGDETDASKSSHDERNLGDVEPI